MKLSDDMDFSIWDCAYSQDECCYLANSWPYDLNFNLQRDVIEEEALNEQSCIQVLNILIAKADTEILEVEENIVMLQTELALADEKWHAMCFTTLSQSINCLDRLIHDLKNDNVNDELRLRIQQMCPKPTERVHEVLRALLQDFFPQSDEQVANAVTKYSAPEPLRDEAYSNSNETEKMIGLEDFCEDEVGELSKTDESTFLRTTEEDKGVDSSNTAKTAGETMVSKVVSINQEAKDSGMKQKYEEVVTARSIKKETTSQLFETKMLSKEVKGQGDILSETNHDVESLLLQFDQKYKDESQTKIKIELQENNSPETLFVSLSESNSSLSLMLSQELMKKEWPVTVKEPCLAEELGVTSLHSRKLKRQFKPGSAAKNLASSAPQRKRKICSDLPVMKENENLRDFQKRLAMSHETFKDVQTTGFPSSGNSGKLAATVDSLVCVADLEYMTKNQLIAIAKEHKLRGWSSLRKEQLLQTLYLYLQDKEAGQM